ncbi:MAG: carbon-nitrogen hydrolase family protein [Nitrospinae bacterium CG11_big_fil_rev_8_21_14_0_20_56_8]|nr:MAG: carbon-nitrogen hydrolase family protein [Nitrospinae bacterium CG11_big_fil_rev_8_21_14_0_20_56_8]
MTRTTMKIGMGQLLVEGGEPERNLERAGEMVVDAAGQGCDLVLLPEALDLAWTHPSAKTESQPIPGPYSDVLCALARDNKVYICAGLTEKDGKRVYNAAVLIDDRGEILLKYRKINVLKVAQDIYSIGRSLAVVETPFGIIGVNICSDNYFDALEIGHTLARMGAQIILSPSSWTVDYSLTEEQVPYGEKWLKPYQSLARLHDLVVVSATAVGVIVGGVYEGKKMVGCSLAVDKNGIIGEGKYNEFAGQLVCVEVRIPPPHPLGTCIGDYLKAMGHYK